MSKKKILLVVGAAAIFLTAYKLGIFDTLSSVASVKEKLLGLGPLGYVAFLVAFALFQPFGVPGIMFMGAASLVWDPLVAVLLSMIGATLSSSLGFGFARYVGRDWVEKRLTPRMRRYDERLAEQEFATVFFLRAFFWTAAWLHLVLGVSRVRFSTHLAASTLAYLPLVLLISFYGDCVFEKLKAVPKDRFVAVGVALALVIFAAWALRRFRAARCPQAPTA